MSYFKNLGTYVSEDLTLVEAILLVCGLYLKASGCPLGVAFPSPVPDLGVAVNWKTPQM